MSNPNPTVTHLCSVLSFLISIEAHDFDRKGGGFEKHVEREHNMWSYLAFFLYLRSKPETEMTYHEEVLFGEGGREREREGQEVKKRSAPPGWIWV